MTEEEEVHRGTEARRLLDHELIVGAFETMETGLLDQFRKTLPTEAARREEIHLLLGVMDLFRSELTRVMETGRLAEVQRGLRDDESLFRKQNEQWSPPQ